MTKLRFALVVALVLVAGVFATHAQSGMGNYSWVDLGSQMRTYKSVCWEASAGVGSDACISHPASGHLGLTAGNGGVASADLMGTKTLSSGAGTVTFTTAFTAAPVVFCTDSTAAAAVRCVASTTAITIAGTGSDVIQYLVLANPN